MEALTKSQIVCRSQNRNRARGLCKCGRDVAANRKSCDLCLSKRRNRVQELKIEGKCISCACRPPMDMQVICNSCATRARKTGRRIRARYRAAVMGHYGSKCACCKESQDEFLTIDHIYNDGKQHRKLVHASKLYPWLVKNSFPEGFQILCWNCNLAKQLHGECPHKRLNK